MTGNHRDTEEMVDLYLTRQGNENNGKSMRGQIETERERERESARERKGEREREYNAWIRKCRTRELQDQQRRHSYKERINLGTWINFYRRL